MRRARVTRSQVYNEHKSKTDGLIGSDHSHVVWCLPIRNLDSQTVGRNELELDNSRCCNILLPLLRTGFLLFVLFSKPLFVYDSVLCIITYWRAKTRLFFIFIEETAATKRDLKLNFVSSALDDDMDRIYMYICMYMYFKCQIEFEMRRIQRDKRMKVDDSSLYHGKNR